MKYHPVQIPYILSKDFLDTVNYSEEPPADLRQFLICFWTISPNSLAPSHSPTTISNIIIADGCIDLIVDFNNKLIGYTGMSKTNFSFRQNSNNIFIGARLKPGAFQAITNLPAATAMDRFLPLESVDPNFDAAAFFAQKAPSMQAQFKSYVASIIKNARPSIYLTLFDNFAQKPPNSVAELCEILRTNPTNLQRAFKKHFGFSPKTALSVLRFQAALILLISTGSTNHILDDANYYDQPHFINDFRKNLGITPRELVRKYQN